jgi:methionyl-tRNA synthetase
MDTSHPLYISTAIPYVNARPHIGTALGYVEADAYARYFRARGQEVYFLAGTDENSLKNVLKAEEAGEEVAAFVARHAQIFVELLSPQGLNISNDDFIRTSADERHFAGVQKLWSSFAPEDIVKKGYTGLYCVGCEEFKTEKELVNGRCPEHPNAELEKVEEENYFFKLSNYEERLVTLIETDELQIVPESRKNEVLAFLRGGLEDLSISRSTKRARGWGVPVPNDPEQVMYVWVDALSNYITALEYATTGEKFQKYWDGADRIVHEMGKGISRFHAIYWPAFLLSAGVRLPTTLFVHGYLTVDGQKISKSLGNTVDPFALIAEYGSDAIRYFFLREVTPFEDSDFTYDRFRDAYNGSLANGIGNLASRILKMYTSYDVAGLYAGIPFGTDQAIITAESEYCAAFEAFRFHDAAGAVWKKIQSIDQRIQEREPFKLYKTDPAAAVLEVGELTAELYKIAVLLRPIIPNAAREIETAIRENRAPLPIFPRK